MQGRGTSPRLFDHVAFGDEVDVIRGWTLGARRGNSYHAVEERVGVRQIQHDSSRAPLTSGVIISVPHIGFRYSGSVLGGGQCANAFHPGVL